MDKREDREIKAMNKPVPPYARLYFDHLYSEYIALKPSIKDAGLIQLRRTPSKAAATRLNLERYLHFRSNAGGCAASGEFGAQGL
jgi:hypothetical protein